MILYFDKLNTNLTRYFVNSYCPSKFRHFMIKIPKKMIDFHLLACDIIETTILIP